jgi:Na+-translocating ferredoxin:NAD+ oxidoreductase subunit D
MMYDVLIALLPAVGVSFYVFGPSAAAIIGLSIASCLAAEAIFQAIRGRRLTPLDGSAVVTGLVLALSLPWTAPWWIPVIGGTVAIIIGKMVFGGLGCNIFNPAMVGRAFLMICFTAELTAWTAGGHGPIHAFVDATTGATPLAAGKFVKASYPLDCLVLGGRNGCLGETSVIALGLGGLYLCLRRTAAWQIPAGVLIGAMFVAALQFAAARFGPTAGWDRVAGLALRYLPPAMLVVGAALAMRANCRWPIALGLLLCLAAVAAVQVGEARYVPRQTMPLTALHHLFGGGLMLGAFFIATDPVSTPVTVAGRWAFGLGLGMLTLVIRIFSTYPEGVMFSVLLMNGVTPMINRWTIPVPVGGVPKAAAAPAKS